MTEISSQTMLLIDKPTGMTSHDVVNIVRRKTGVKRVGHAGTLDPLATGLLIILVGREETKKQDHYMHMDKEYECTAQFGIVTDSYDSDGKVLSEVPWKSIEKISEEDILQKLLTFTGKISQTVPIYSAVKIKGKKLYEYARQGKELTQEIPTRQVEVFSYQLMDFKKDTEGRKLFASFRIHCSSGTYVRSLIHDLGQALEVGATVTALRRTKIGTFSVDNARDPFQI